MFFSDWFGLLRVVIVGTLTYVALVLLLRVSGKRTLSKMNAFDFIVTVALGSTLATVLLSKDVALAEGITAFALLIGLQYIITWLSVRSHLVENWVKAEPSLLFFEGRFLDEALRRERVTQAEVRAAVRSQGLSEMEGAAAVILETDGSITVLKNQNGQKFTSLKGVAPESEKGKKMEKLVLEGNQILNLPGFTGVNARIVECETAQQFSSWCDGETTPDGEAMACRHQNRVYVKTPKSLNQTGDFALDYDCLTLEEANDRIEKWNTEQPV